MCRGSISSRGNTEAVKLLLTFGCKMTIGCLRGLGVQYIRHKKLSMKRNAVLNEKWLQQRIFEDPSLLGFGDVNVKGMERSQPHGGRLDMLLSDPETDTRYEVELQLGATDESHIIRTIEYWDEERRRYPQYDHVAVIVAEEVTARFFNVISLFNGFIPIVAIQVSAIQVAEGEVTLVFTTVLDRATLGTEDEDDGPSSDRAYWESKTSPDSMKFLDEVEALVQQIDPNVNLNYKKGYVGLATNGVSTNYLAFKPKKQQINIHIKIPRNQSTEAEIEDAGLVSFPYQTRWNQYRPVFPLDSFETHKELLEKWALEAHANYFGSN